MGSAVLCNGRPGTTRNANGLHYWDLAAEAITTLAGGRQAGKLKYRVDGVDGLQNAPQALDELFDGGNVG